MKVSKKTKALLASWGRSFAAAGLAVVLANLQAGVAVDPQAVLIAGLVAVLPVVLRWLNPKDPAFGRGA